MKKLKFNHKSEEMNVALGVTMERLQQLQKAVGHGVVEMDNESSKTELYEYVEKSFKPANEQELFAMGVMLGMHDAMREAMLESHAMKHAILNHAEKAKEHPLSAILKKEKRYEA